MSPYMVKRMVGLATVVATVVLAIVLSIVIIQTVQLSRLSAEAKLLDLNIEKLLDSKANLESGIEERLTEEYIEEQARENLGLIKDGELIFIYG